MSRRPVPVAVACLRLARLGLHFAKGLWIVETRYRQLDPQGQDQELERWSRGLLAILRVRVVGHNAPAIVPEPCLLVTNHVSWLDIFAVYTILPSLFVAKSEVRRWPLVGRLVARVGTLFVERGSRRNARVTNDRVVAALGRGRLVAVCPEGTTTDGRTLKAFHAALLQPAIDAEATVLPIALRYVDAGGEQTDAAAYVGEMSLVESLWRIARAPSLVVELRFAGPIDARAMRRRELAARTRSVIARELDLPLGHTAPGTAAGPRAEPPSAPHPTRTPYPAPADPA
jgi:1-acyl-sn-glycerol-3-phosphate acyltransferase